jgi:cytidylate kinase
MAVITISRETGSGGSEIAEKLARKLGYHLADKETMGRILAEYGFVEFRETYETEPSFWTRFDLETGAVIAMLDKATRALAAHGDIVIVGRGSFAVLAGFRDVLNVRIKAPFHFRVMHYMEEHAIPEYEEAERNVRESDRVRTAFLESFYNVGWDQAKGFDLIIDTEKIPKSLAVEWIAGTVEKALAKLAWKGPMTESINVDTIMASSVAGVLNCTEKHGSAVTST